MIRLDVTGLADLVEALEAEIIALISLDPYDPQISALRERMENARHQLYDLAPRGV